MRVTDITDIEDLILCKHEIDTVLIEKGDQEEKMPLDMFMVKYINLNNTTYIHGDIMVAFSVVEVYDHKYLFVSEKNEEAINEIVNLLNAIDFDYSKLSPLSNIELANTLETRPLLLVGKKYYNATC